MEKEQVICDTDVMIDFLDRRNPRHAPTKNILENEIGLDFVTISAMTKMELISGASDKIELNRTKKNIDRFNVFLINSEISSIAVHLMEEYKLSHSLAIPDSIIAATSVFTRFKLFTYNVRDFKFITGIRLYQSVTFQQ